MSEAHALEPALAAERSVHLAKLAGVTGETGCSSFVAFAWLDRLERLSPDAARAIAADRAAVYEWYLRVYAPSQAPARAPLSAADRAWLLSEATFPGIPFPVPRVVSWFALRPHSEGGPHMRAADEAALAAWWCDLVAPTLNTIPALLPVRYLALLGRDAPQASGMPTPTRRRFAFDVEVAGPLSRASGLARAARATVATFRQAGLKVKATDTSHGHLALADPDYASERPSEGEAPATIFHLNPDTLPLAFAFGADRFAARRAGLFFWELDRPSTADFLGLDLVDEVWAASRFVQGVYAPWFDGPVPYVGMAVEAAPANGTEETRAALRRDLGVPAETTVFVATFDGYSFLERKNPLGAVQAFRRAFPERADVVLVLKGHHRPDDHAGGEAAAWRGIDAAVAADARIRLIERTLPHEQVMRLVSGADCYVSLHRSEGFGLGPAEAMLRGVPAIVTAYGGTEDFCDDATSLRISCRMSPVGLDAYLHTEPGRLWADPDIDLAAGAMRRIAADPAFARRLGEAGRQAAEHHFSLSAAAGRYVAALERLIAQPGRRP
ncbi:MAG: glycosyltransferase family 4 protein [Alphaproteobacteria bacterium]|nr:glycosyltransferase family 4 protein [Alphaproteobacteria bacterium]